MPRGIYKRKKGVYKKKEKKQKKDKKQEHFERIYQTTPEKSPNEWRQFKMYCKYFDYKE